MHETKSFGAGCCAGVQDIVGPNGSERVRGAARQGDVGHLNVAAYHPNRSPQAAALGGSTHLRSPLRADLVCPDLVPHTCPTKFGIKAIKGLLEYVASI